MADDRLTNGDYVWNQLDYGHDALIEASAGTGKTYALESIVLKLICDKGYDAKSILLVTYTEKAAGELKDRVRRALARKDRLPPDFDEMTICTIHSFCQRLLGEYAFENGVPMRCDVGGDNAEFIRRAVRFAVCSGEFAARYRETFVAFMDAAGYSSVDDLMADAAGMMNRCLLEDEPVPGSGDASETPDEDVARLAAFADFNFDGYDVHGSDKRGFAESCGIIRENIGGLRSGDLSAVVSSVTAMARAVAKLNPRVTGRGRNVRLQDVYPDLKRFAVAVCEVHKVFSSRLAVCAASLAWPEFERIKAESALLTFDDLVSRAAEVVMKPPRTREEKAAKNSFLRSVRGRYRVALVDEFQDTDQKQWDIFRTLFSWKENKVEDGKPGFLLVVGDPKQAIYSFRGADVDVYCRARDVLTGNDGSGDGRSERRKTLAETYRSKSSLVDAFNTFFGGRAADTVRSDWFEAGAAGGGIGYEKVKYPAGGNEKFGGSPPDGGSGFVERESAPVLLLESMPGNMQPSAHGGGRFGRKARCLPVFMENAAAEMKYLAGLDWAYKVYSSKRNGFEEKRYRYSDMCILVEGRDDAAVVRKILAKHGIPYGQYKQRGLYDSAEAEGVLALLDCLSNPVGRGNRQALLLSPVFGVHPSGLGGRTSEDERAFDAFIGRLLGYARAKEWNRLFDRVMSDDCTALTRPRGDVCAFNRTRSAVRQILDALLEERGRLAETAADFAATLRAWRKNDKTAGEDGSLYRKESAADRVQIMTMHASKGLQFPVVFLAYGFSDQVKRGTPEEERPAALQERRRLLYVALTRAEHRLYLPWSKRAWEWTAAGKNGPIAGSGIGSAGSALLSSSVSGFLGRAIQVYFKDRHDEAFAPARSENGVASAGEGVRRGGTHVKRTAGAADCRIMVPGLEDRRVRWDSFSSLRKKCADAATEAPVEAEREISVEGGASRENEPQDLTVKSETLLPRNNVSGNVFHEIMEALCNNDGARGEVDFATACAEGMEKDDSGLMALIRQKMRKNLLANREKNGDSTERTLLRMVQNALRTKIAVGSHVFRLTDIPKRDRLAEIEFVASETRLLALPQERDGALNGKIDLLVRRDGNVFILDWKTNSLSDYTSSDVIAAAMDEAGYRLQYQLYSLAAAAWIEKSSLTLAGAAYLFVRGGEVGPECGVFSEEFEPERVDGFRRDISAMGFFSSKKENG